MPISRIVSNAAKKVSSLDRSMAAADRRFDRRRGRRRRILFRRDFLPGSFDGPGSGPDETLLRDTSQPPNAFHKDTNKLTNLHWLGAPDPNLWRGKQMHSTVILAYLIRIFLPSRLHIMN